MRKLTSAILAVGLAVSAPLAAAAQQLSLNEISGYLNQLRTAKGDFTQINDDGSISTGTIYIKREVQCLESDLQVGDSRSISTLQRSGNTDARTHVAFPPGTVLQG